MIDLEHGIKISCHQRIATWKEIFKVIFLICVFENSFSGFKFERINTHLKVYIDERKKGLNLKKRIHLDRRITPIHSNSFITEPWMSILFYASRKVGFKYKRTKNLSSFMKLFAGN